MSVADGKFGYVMDSRPTGYVGVGPTAVSAVKQLLQKIEDKPIELVISVRYWAETDDFEAIGFAVG